MKRANEIIDKVSALTDSVVLMHSMSGKDSIALLDMLYPKFKRIVCVYMYVVKDLRHIAEYSAFIRKRYDGVETVQVPHFAWFSYKRNGFMGSEKLPIHKNYCLYDIVDTTRKRLGIEWVCLGFKQSDSLNRLLMLRSLKDGNESIMWKSKWFFPLSTYKNADVMDYISDNNLKSPERYGGKSKSSGTDITDYWYLRYLREHYPDDLEKVYAEYPQTKFIIAQHERDTKGKQ